MELIKGALVYSLYLFASLAIVMGSYTIVAVLFVGCYKIVRTFLYWG